MSSLATLAADVNFQENTALHALNLTYILKEIPPMSFVKISEIYRAKLTIQPIFAQLDLNTIVIESWS